MSTILILGGTGEARTLAELLEPEFEILTSLAGRVREPRLPVGPVRSGGFGGISGLADFLADRRIGAVVDATHPFARTISANAVAAASVQGTPLLRLERPAWMPVDDDRWIRVPTIAAAATKLGELPLGGPSARVFLTTGRQDVGTFAAVGDPWFLIRVVDPPESALPPRSRLLRSRGPFLLGTERELLRENRITVLVTKNSGGRLVRAKLDAARELALPVIVVDRPEPPGGDYETVTDPAAAADWVRRLMPT